jgi:hypothetical protein
LAKEIKLQSCWTFKLQNTYFPVMKKLPFAACSLLLAFVAVADVRLPAVIGPHMVLQQATDARLWGWCDPNEKIEVRTTWDTTTYTTKGLSDATWQLTIKTPKAGGPYVIHIKGTIPSPSTMCSLARCGFAVAKAIWNGRLRGVCLTTKK